MAKDNNLCAPQFQNEDKAREYLEAVTWPNGRVCPHCGVIGDHYPLKGKTTRPGLYSCTDCRKPFTVTVGTLFERSHIPLHKWLMAVYLMSSSKKGISSHQLHRTLGVTYKTAWFMTHRIREAMADPAFAGPLGGASSPVEADETYWGSQIKGVRRRRKIRNKMKIVSLVERHGHVRSFHVPNVNAANLKPILQEHVRRDTHLMTDEAGVYRTLGKKLFSAHSYVNHTRDEYVRGNVSTNTVEGYFSILKRGLIGTFHHVGEQHLRRYVKEFDFRYNYRTALGYTDVERSVEALKRIRGKRLTYKGSDKAKGNTEANPN